MNRIRRSLDQQTIERYGMQTQKWMVVRGEVDHE